MSRSTPRTAGAPLPPRGRMRRPLYVFVMSGLGALVVGAAFWSPAATQRRMAVRMAFDPAESATEIRDRIAALETSAADPAIVARWAAEADANETPKAALVERLAAFAPPLVRSESTIQVVPIEDADRVTAVEIRFSDSDALRAERFAAVVSRQFGTPAADVVADATPEAVVSEESDARAKARIAAREETLRRKREELSKSIEAHFAALRSLRAKMADEPESVDVSTPATSSKDASTGSRVRASLPAFIPAGLGGVLWQVPANQPSEEILIRLEGLDRDIAAKELAREELLQKFTPQHPVAVALDVALVRLKRERREIAALIDQAESTITPTPEPIAPPAEPSPAVLPPATAPAPIAPPAPVVPVQEEPRETPTPEPPVEEIAPEPEAIPTPTAAPESDERLRAVAAALDEALRAEEDLAVEIEALATASERLAAEAPGSVAATPADASVAPANVTIETLDAGLGELTQPRYAALGGFALLFATTMTALVLLLGRDRAVSTAEEVSLAAGMPVIGQTHPGLIDRKPRRNWALGLVTGSLRLVEGATVLTAFACVVALAAENPRAGWIVSQPLAAFWQAMQSVM